MGSLMKQGKLLKTVINKLFAHERCHLFVNNLLNRRQADFANLSANLGHNPVQGDDVFVEFVPPRFPPDRLGDNFY